MVVVLSVHVRYAESNNVRMDHLQEIPSRKWLRHFAWLTTLC
jgi:hypothetical protein